MTEQYCSKCGQEIRTQTTLPSPPKNTSFYSYRGNSILLKTPKERFWVTYSTASIRTKRLIQTIVKLPKIDKYYHEWIIVCASGEMEANFERHNFYKNLTGNVLDFDQVKHIIVSVNENEKQKNTSEVAQK